MSKLNIGIVGGTGYTGVELLRILAVHPHAQLTAITSRSEAGLPVADMFPSLRGFVDLRFTDPTEANLAACDDLIAEAVYGLPELNRDKIRSARLVANPGCYPTSVQLGFMPLLEAGVVDATHLIADVKSGVSGAGRKAETHTLFAEAGDNFKAYAVAGHRHQPEISQGLAEMARTEVGLTFVPHLTPLIRGIHATLYARMVKQADLQALFETRYANERYVDVMPKGTHPETRSVRGSNLCRISVHQPQGSDTIVVLSVIDNLVKGAAGQAVQNMNIMFGLDERTGLEIVPLLP